MYKAHMWVEGWNETLCGLDLAYVTTHNTADVDCQNCLKRLNPKELESNGYYTAIRS